MGCKMSFWKRYHSCLIQIHCSCGYFWPGCFFFLLKRTNLAKMNLHLFLFSADCLLEREKKGKKISLPPSLSFSLSLVDTPTLPWWCCSTLITHACVHLLALTDTNTHIKKNYWYTCTLTYIYFVLLDFVWNFWSKVLNIVFRGKSKYFSDFLQLSYPVLA